MSTMKRALFAAILALVVAVSLPFHASPQLANDVDTYVRALAKAGVPGIAVAVATGHQKPQLSSAGNLGATTPMPIASLTKSITATAVLTLVRQDRVQLDTPINTYLPQLRIADPRASSITVRHVLNQSSGLTDHTLGFDQYRVQPDSAQEALALLSLTKLAYDPGSSWDYCNVNYWIAQALVETVSGRTLNDYARHELFAPLGMDATSVDNATGGRTDAVPLHVYLFGRVAPLPPLQTFAGGAGGGWSTVADLATWASFHQGFAPGGEQILPDELRAELQRRQSPLHEYSVGYALGWWNGEPADGGERRISHSGTGPGHSTYIGMFPDGTSVVVLVTANSPRSDLIANGVREILTGIPAQPAGAPAPWIDGGVVLGALALGYASWLGTRRCRRTVAGRVTAKVLAVSGGLVIALLPAALLELFGRQANWQLIMLTAPVPAVSVLGVALCWIGCAFNALGVKCERVAGIGLSTRNN